MNLNPHKKFSLKGKGSPFDFRSDFAFHECHSPPQIILGLQRPAMPLDPARVLLDNGILDPCTCINNQVMILAY